MRESAEEVAAVSGPYETFGDDQVTFVVDLEAAVVHQPRPGSFDDPAFGEDREPMSVDTVHDFDGDCQQQPEGVDNPECSTPEIFFPAS